jgi:uncharacterized protein YmfQ (DUF2313 family)
MQKLWSKKHISAGLVVMAIVAAVPFAANAQPARALEAQTEAQQRQETAQATAAEKQAAAQTRLTDTKLKVCQLREKTVGNIMARMSDRGAKQLDVFSKIADRTEAFYVKAGKVLSNYDVLVADVVATKADAQTAVDAVKNTSTTFKCDGTNPKGVASSFKASLEAQNKALKAYKTAVKNLIVGVKSVQGTTTESTTKTSDGSTQ